MRTRLAGGRAGRWPWPSVVGWPAAGDGPGGAGRVAGAGERADRPVATGGDGRRGPAAAAGRTTARSVLADRGDRPAAGPAAGARSCSGPTLWGRRRGARGCGLARRSCRCRCTRRPGWARSATRGGRRRSASGPILVGLVGRGVHPRDGGAALGRRCSRGSGCGRSSPSWRRRRCSTCPPGGCLAGVTLRRSVGALGRRGAGGGRADGRRHDGHRPAPGPDLRRGGLRPVSAWATARARGGRRPAAAGGPRRPDRARWRAACSRPTRRGWPDGRRPGEGSGGSGRWRVPLGLARRGDGGEPRRPAALQPGLVGGSGRRGAAASGSRRAGRSRAWSGTLALAAFAEAVGPLC